MGLLSISLKWRTYLQARNVTIFDIVGGNCIVMIMAQWILSVPIPIQRHLSSAVFALSELVIKGLNFYHFRSENLWHKAQAYKTKIWYLKTAPLGNTNQRDVSLKRWALCFGEDVIVRELWEIVFACKDLQTKIYAQKLRIFETRRTFPRRGNSKSAQGVPSRYPGYQRFFLACVGKLRFVGRRPKAEETSGEAARKNLWRRAPWFTVLDGPWPCL